MGVESGVNESHKDAVGVAGVDAVTVPRVETEGELEIEGDSLKRADCEEEAVFEIDGVRDGETLSVPFIPVAEGLIVPEKYALADTRIVSESLFVVTLVPDTTADHVGETLG